jgi:hypothetical protein
MVMRSKFVGADNNIHCYEVQWEPEKLSWESFRGELLGPTDPKVSLSMILAYDHMMKSTVLLFK